MSEMYILGGKYHIKGCMQLCDKLLGLHKNVLTKISIFLSRFNSVFPFLIFGIFDRISELAITCHCLTPRAVKVVVDSC